MSSNIAISCFIVTATFPRHEDIELRTFLKILSKSLDIRFVFLARLDWVEVILIGENTVANYPIIPDNWRLP